MNATGVPVPPPRMAAWFVQLFASPQEADAILGDLVEEFQSAAAEHGEREARRRFRVHTLQTIRDLAMTPWRSTAGPGGRATRALSGIGMGVIALAVTWAIAWTFNYVARSLVVQMPVYDYVPAVWFWQTTDFAGPLISGMLAALLARALGLRPMSVAVSTLAAMAVLFALDVPVGVWLFGPPPRTQITFSFIAVRWLYGVTVFGGLFWLGSMLGRMLPSRSGTLRHA
jgi:hypothetical protein